MNKTLLLIKQNYLQKIKAKSFLLITLLYMAVILIAVNWSSIKDIFSGDDQVTVALVDETKQLAANFPASGEIAYKKVDASRKTLDQQVKDGDYDGALYLQDQKGQLQTTFVTYESPTLTLQQSVETHVDSASKIYGIQQLNLSAKEAETLLNAQANIKEVSLKEADSGKSSQAKMVGIGVSYVIGFLIYLFVLTYSSMITTDIASEKGSRVLEVLMASVRPNQHLMAKIVSVFAVGFTQIVILIATALIAFNVTNRDLWKTITDMTSDLSSAYIWIVALFFILTLLLYLTLGALMGSLVSKVEEAGQANMPVMMLMMAGFFSLVYGMSNPDIALVRILSFVPFTSGMLMPLRYSATDLSTTSAIIALAILAVTLAVIFVFTVSLYRRSVLTYSTGSLWQKLKNVWKFTT
ncbi:ABC transporter permease [Kurthia massiliensis]|uniref:ABC transporter permease n=1 Tax=Kurthia massiliensis TaxID=1033739 RepID=UPI00028961E3|nr:ABC transporter permease [Kurthia massiliensis]